MLILAAVAAIALISGMISFTAQPERRGPTFWGTFITGVICLFAIQFVGRGG